MTRFNAQGPRIQYKPVPRENLSEKALGLFGMWAALSPETRKKIANFFRRDKTADVTPTEEQTEAAEDYMEAMNAGLDVPLFNALNTSELGLISDPATKSQQDNALTWLTLIDAGRGLDKAQAMALGNTYEEPIDDYRNSYRRSLAKAKENW